jgi:uncharacterized membrane protein
MSDGPLPAAELAPGTASDGSERRLEIAQWLLIAAMFVLAAWAWPRVPDQVPVHWNLAGQADRYGGKVEGLLLVPLLSLGLYALFRVLPRLDPGGANYARFRRPYGVIRVAVLASMLAIQLAVVAAALGTPVDITRILMVVIGAMFAVMGSVLPGVQPNWFVGIRTPWTLSSQRSWTATHKLGGRVFMGVGLATVLIGVVQPQWAFWVLLLGMGVGVTVLFAYSYRVWRDDPDKAAPLGTGGGAP